MSINRTKHRSSQGPVTQALRHRYLTDTPPWTCNSRVRHLGAISGKSSMVNTYSDIKPITLLGGTSAPRKKLGHPSSLWKSSLRRASQEKIQTEAQRQLENSLINCPFPGSLTIYQGPQGLRKQDLETYCSMYLLSGRGDLLFKFYRLSIFHDPEISIS